MPKLPISVTIEEDNLLWLRGQARASGRRSVSSTLDRLITDARKGGRHVDARSVVGTIDIDRSDPGLLGADVAIRRQVESSTGKSGRPRG